MMDALVRGVHLVTEYNGSVYEQTVVLEGAFSSFRKSDDEEPTIDSVEILKIGDVFEGI